MLKAVKLCSFMLLEAGRKEVEREEWKGREERNVRRVAFAQLPG